MQVFVIIQITSAEQSFFLVIGRRQIANGDYLPGLLENAAVANGYSARHK
jgi:hypothetical protein